MERKSCYLENISDEIVDIERLQEIFEEGYVKQNQIKHHIQINSNHLQ